MNVPAALIFVGATTRRADDPTVVRELNRRKDARAALIEFIDESIGNPSSELRLEILLDQLSDESEERRRTTIPLIAHAGSARNQLALISIVSAGRLMLIQIEHLADPSYPWGSSVSQVSDESIISVVRRAATESMVRYQWADLSSRIAAEIGYLNSLHLSSVFEDITRLARTSFDDEAHNTLSRRHAFESILDTRSRLHNALAHLEAQGIRGVRIQNELKTATAACDSLISALTGMSALIMQEQATVHEKAQAARDSQMTNRDRLIAQLAAALLLPGLWFAFLGTNTIPDELWSISMQSELTFVITLTVGLILGVAGWFIIPRFVSRG